MKVKVYLFPDYVGIRSLFNHSPVLMAMLEGLGIVLERHDWHGTLDSVPDNGPVMVRSSSMMMCRNDELAALCRDRDHFVFYDDHLLCEDGSMTKAGRRQAVKDFVERLRAFQRAN